MSSNVFVNTYAHSVTYIADKMLTSVKNIIVQSGLSPEKLADDWTVLERGISAWLHSRHLKRVVLEVFDPRSDRLVGRWDFDVVYSSAGSDGGFWADPEDIRYAIKKAGTWPSTCDYTVIVTNEVGRPPVAGWGKAEFRPTDGLIRQSIGTTAGAGELSTGTAYWRPK